MPSRLCLPPSCQTCFSFATYLYAVMITMPMHLLLDLLSYDIIFVTFTFFTHTTPYVLIIECYTSYMRADYVICGIL